MRETEKEREMRREIEKGQFSGPGRHFSSERFREEGINQLQCDSKYLLDGGKEGGRKNS